MRGLLVMVLPEATSELFVLLLLFVMTAIVYICPQYLGRGGGINQLGLATALN